MHGVYLADGWITCSYFRYLCFSLFYLRGKYEGQTFLSSFFFLNSCSYWLFDSHLEHFKKKIIFFFLGNEWDALLLLDTAFYLENLISARKYSHTKAQDVYRLHLLQIFKKSNKVSFLLHVTGHNAWLPILFFSQYFF